MATFWDITDGHDRIEISGEEAYSLEAEGMIVFDHDESSFSPLVSWPAIETRILELFERNTTAVQAD